MGDGDSTEAFHPRGAIAFFAAMTVFFSVVWLALYALMIYRH
jgi:preprotein translocase subunit SecG